MEATTANQTVTSTPPSRVKELAIRIAALALFSVFLCSVYGWAAPRTYARERPAGFPLGLMHGALMPAALPALVGGKDLPIYATNNRGRDYNIGFILGLNSCGTLFFGIAFWHPRRR